MTVRRSYRFGNKHVEVLSGTASLADMVNTGYDILYGRQYGANTPGSREAQQYGPTWTTINTLLVFSQGGWMTLASEIEARNGASGQYAIKNGVIFVTEGRNQQDWGHRIGSEGSVHLTIERRQNAFEIVHLENTRITVPLSGSWNAKQQLHVQSFRPVVSDLTAAKAKLKHVSPTQINDRSTMGNVGRVVYWPQFGAARMRAAAIRARELEAEDVWD